MEHRQQTDRTGQARNGAAKDSPAPGRCVLLVHPRRALPQALAESLRRRGVEVRLEREPVLALAELGRCMIEHRECSARRHASFHDRGTAQAATSPPSLMLIVADPGDFADVDELIECAARSMPGAALAVFDGSPERSLRLIRGPAPRTTIADAVGAGPARRAARAGGEESEPPPVVVRPARSEGPALRLAAHDDSSPLAAPGEGANRAAAGGPRPLGAAAEEDARPEVLLTDEELAMLLGDDESAGEAPCAGGAA